MDVFYSIGNNILGENIESLMGNKIVEFHYLTVHTLTRRAFTEHIYIRIILVWDLNNQWRLMDS